MGTDAQIYFCVQKGINNLRLGKKETKANSRHELHIIHAQQWLFKGHNYQTAVSFLVTKLTFADDWGEIQDWCCKISFQFL